MRKREIVYVTVSVPIPQRGLLSKQRTKKNPLSSQWC